MIIKKRQCLLKKERKGVMYIFKKELEANGNRLDTIQMLIHESYTFGVIPGQCVIIKKILEKAFS